MDKQGNPVMIPGSLKSVKAIGWFIEEYGVAQISMNLTNISVTPVILPLMKYAKRPVARGIRVTGSELVGSGAASGHAGCRQVFFTKTEKIHRGFGQGTDQDCREIHGPG